MIALLLACRHPDPHLPPYGGWPVWVDEDTSDAVDLGHTPRFVEPGPPAALVFAEVADEIGLGAAAGGGNQHGVGVALVDLDGDGWLEVVIANGVSNVTGDRTRSMLFWNVGGIYVDGTDALGDALVGRDLYSVAAGDVDNDGDVDLYFGGQPTDVLLANQGDRTFAEVTGSRDAGGPPSDPSLVADGRGKIVSIGDVDNDGWQDLVSATSTRTGSARDEGAAVLRNVGGARFVDFTERAGTTIAGDGNPCAVMFTDYDNDGWRDLWIWNDRGGHVLLHNTGGGVYEDFENSADRVTIHNPMGIDGADIDRDGDLDYYVSNIGDHPLLVNLGNGMFSDRTRAWGSAGDFGWGLAFEDFDLDGLADLLVTQEDQRDALVYRNLGGRFEASSLAMPDPLNLGAAHNVPAAFGDIDHDGRVDAIAVHTDGSPLVAWRNVTEVAGRHWLEVRIPESPGTGEAGGIGARVVVRTGDELQFRDITGGASRGSQNALSVRFGLGGWDGADVVFVAWPDGRTASAVNVPADAILEL